MSESTHDEASVRAVRWLLGGLNGWVDIFTDLVVKENCLSPDEIERLERCSDRIAEMVKDQKAKAGLDASAKTY